MQTPASPTLRHAASGPRRRRLTQLVVAAALALGAATAGSASPVTVSPATTTS